jgi:RimJ/RimL family protein N-acetyltransferase
MIEKQHLMLRPATDADLPFLFQVYAHTRLDELAPLAWSAEQVNAFLNQQFWAQHTHYHEQSPHADYSIILSDSQPVGRIYIERRDHEIELIDIALLPAYRGQGIGTELLRALLNEAAQAQKPVRLYVEDFNPAYRLYSRFGFQPIGTNGVYTYMEWIPQSISEER